MTANGCAQSHGRLGVRASAVNEHEPRICRKNGAHVCGVHCTRAANTCQAQSAHTLHPPLRGVHHSMAVASGSSGTARVDLLARRTTLQHHFFSTLPAEASLEAHPQSEARRALSSFVETATATAGDARGERQSERCVHPGETRSIVQHHSLRALTRSEATTACTHRSKAMGMDA